MKYLALLPLGIVFSGFTYAELGEPGFSGEISLLAGVSHQKSNTTAKTKNGKLNSDGETESSFAFQPLGQLLYTFGDDNNHQFYLGTAREDVIEGVIAIELGYSYGFDDSTISFGYLPSIANGEVWEDPYLTNSEKKNTSIKGNTYRVQYDNILGTGFSADAAIYNQDVKNEKSGSTLANNRHRLQRDAKGYRLNLSSGFEVSDVSFVEPSFSFQRHSADGKAVSFNRYGLSLTYVHLVGNHAFSINGDYSLTQYDAQNPLFNKTQKDNSYGVNLGYEYSEFMGWEDWGLTALAGYSNTSSNITFYDATDYMAGIGLTYHF